MTAEIETRGTTFLSVQGALADLKGQVFVDRVIDAMPKDGKEALRYGSVIATGWYPIRWYRELFTAAVELSGDVWFPRAIGRASIRREIRGVHRLIFRVVTVEMLQKQGARFFQSYFRPTECTLELAAARHGITRYAGCVGFDRNLWLEQLGCIEELLVQARVELPRVRILNGGGDGDAHCEVETRWR